MTSLIRHGFVGFVLIFLSGTATADVQSFVIDADHTHVSFTVDRFGFAKTLGVFPESAGTILFDEEDIANSSVMASVRTASVWTGLALRDDVVVGDYWLNAEKFPQISFASNQVVQSEDDSLEIKGDFTIWGETRPVTFRAKLNKVGADRTAKGKEAIGLSIEGKILRSDFGHKTALGFVGDEVFISIETIAHLKE